MEIRNQRQQEAADSYQGGRKLIKAAPRFGKIKTSINIFRTRKCKNICICFPRNEIKTSWADDFNKWGFDGNITYSTFRSVKKVTGKYDLVILDEINEASPQELKDIKESFKEQEDILALSGTVTQKTYKSINYNLGIEICYEYSIEQAVKEGIVSDYTIYLHKVSLDKIIPKYKNKAGKLISEKSRFDNYIWVREKLMDEKKPYFFIDLKLISIIQDSLSKTNKTKELLEKNKNKRCLVFTGLTNVADNLGVPVYHSKSKEKTLFQDFCNDNGVNQLACVKLIQSGITIKPIDFSVINYTSGNPEDTAQKICRMIGIEYENPEKKAEIHIICSTEPFEEERLTTALSFFDERKIKIVKL